jgi:hypothetical protein
MASLNAQIATAIGNPGVFVPRGEREAASCWSARAVIVVLAEALAVHPCHITGMHEPDHHTRYLCTDQKAAALDGLLAGLGLEFADLPRRLHDRCGWCHEIPTQERYRERLRRSYRWAGVEIPPELAEPAPDASRPGDTDLVLAHIPADWRHWPDVLREIEAANPIGWTRISEALHALDKAGEIEMQHRSGGGSPDVRRVPVPVSAEG